MQINLVGQLHLLSSTISVLAVPTPSLTAIVARKIYIHFALIVKFLVCFVFKTDIRFIS